MTPWGGNKGAQWLACIGLAAALLPASAQVPPHDIPTDRLIVRLKGGAPGMAKGAADREALVRRLSLLAGQPLAAVRVMGDGAQIVRLPRRMKGDEIREQLRALEADPEVAEILPDRIFRIALTPTDPQYPAQWSLHGTAGINAPAAWDVTTGSPTLVIGIVDTGKLPHSDLGSRWTGGYDFVSSTERSNDGDTRDGDASDPGDWVTEAESSSGPLATCPVTDSRWHGSAMAGVIGASANNAFGIAGVNWSSRLLPVRVVGKCGGYESDIADGIRWAAGIGVPGVPANPDVANLLNVSLSAPGACSSALQSAINEAVTAGTPVVAAAGNSTLAASGFSPANCAGVIAVGATDANGGKPAYANFGPPIALSAPGGIASIASGTEEENWVLTTSDSGVLDTDSGRRTTPAYDNLVRALNGTSIAAAHVTGIASLMLTVNPSLLPEGLKVLLASTARAFPAGTTALGSQADCTAALCGAGIADAAAAVQAARDHYFTTPAMVSARLLSGLGLRTDGTVFGWGQGFGDGSSATAVAGMSGVVQVAAGQSFYLARRAEGVVLSWGSGTDNNFGQLGDGTTTNRSTVGLVAEVAGATDIAAGLFHGLALLSDGTVKAWGGNAVGQLGDGTIVNRSTPAPVVGVANVTAIAAGAQSSFAVKSDGTVWAWGAYNGSSAPQQVAGFSAIVGISGTDSHLLALRNDGTVWAVGLNALGQLGDGTNTFRTTPVQVPGLPVIAEISAGHAHFSLARGNDGTVWAWGANDVGQLGDGTNTNRSGAVQVAGLSQVVGIEAGHDFGFAWRADGSLFAWGSNALGVAANGQLGVGPSALEVAVPTRVRLGTGSYLFVAAHSEFVAVEVPTSVMWTSNPLRASGIANGSEILVSGGEYSIGCTGSYTAAPGTIDNHALVCARAASASGCGVTTTATLTIAGLPAKPFSLTTVCNAVPNPFGPFVPHAGVEPNTVHTSNSVTITGIDGPALVTVSGGSYSIGCTSTFTSDPGTIVNGQQVCVRQTASGSFNTYTRAVLTIGGVSASFDVTTRVAAGFTTPAMVSARLLSGLGLRTDGTVFGWGQGFGDGSSATAVAGLSGVVQVAAGQSFYLARRAEGVVLSWGHGTDNNFGQLGDGTTTNRATVGLVAEVAGATDIAAGLFHGLALLSDGTVKAWGYNANGQLGDGTTTNRPTPTPVVGLANVVAVEAWTGSSFALKSDGTVWAWGQYNAALVPAQVAGLAGVTAIAASDQHLLALLADGSVRALGANGHGQLGDGTNTPRASPVQVPGLSGVVAVKAGNFHSLALKADGTVWGWGANDVGQLGDGTNTNRPSAVQVAGLSQVVGIEAGHDFGFAWRADGSLFAWGSNALGVAANGQLGIGLGGLQLALPTRTLSGDGDFFGLRFIQGTPFMFVSRFGAALSTLVVSNPVTLTGLSAPASVAVAGGEYSLNGGAFTSAAGLVGNGDSITVRVLSSAAYASSTVVTLTIGGGSGRSAAFHVRTEPGPEVANTRVGVATGDGHTYLVNAAGDVFSAGYNGNGQLGNGTALGLSTFQPVAAIARIVGVASGGFHGLALRADGTVAAWGSNAAGQLGHGTTTDSERYPVEVASLTGISAVAAGKYHSLAAASDGSVWAWGLNTSGQVGAGSPGTAQAVPLQVQNLSGVLAVAAGGRHSLALRVDGSVMAWGANEFGQLGDGSTTSRSAPAPVPGLTDAIAIAAGDAHSLAIRSDGSVVAWGFNAFGQLGDGSTANRLAPVAVSTLGTGVGLIAAGSNHSLAVKVGGALYAWGNNANSQLGNGNNLNQLVPAALATPAGVVAVAGGARHSAAITAERKLYVWGDNFFGQVGNRSGNYSPHSASLNVLRGDSVISTGTSGSGGGVGTGSNSGSSVLEIDNQQAGFDFGSIGAGTSRAIAGKFKNAAPSDNVTGVSLSVTGAGFSLAASDCPPTLAPNQECGFTIGFVPAGSADYSGELMVQSSVVGSPERRSLRGSAVTALPAVALAQSGVDFPPQTVWTPASAPLSITNTGVTSLTVSAVTSALGDFAATHDCVNVAPGSSCNLQVGFAPIAVGSRVGQLSVVSNAQGSPHVLTVSGTGVASPSPPPSFALTVARVGSGTGSVTSTNPASPTLDCGPTCSATYVAGTVVTLTATPTSGSTFAGWSGPCTGTGTCTVTMNQAKTVTAAFASPGTFALDVVKAGTGAGIVASTLPASPSINCGATCIQTYAAGTVVTLDATPSAGSTFDGWSGACSGTGTCQVTMSAARSVTATFTLANPPRLGNISTRMQVLTGNDVMIGGFVIGGSANKTVVVRARGPSLIPFGIANALPNPQLQLVRSSDQQQVAANDDWQSAPNAADLTASGFAPSNNLEAALLVSLPPGAYTAIVSGVGNGTGVGIVEVFEVDGPELPLLNISTRGQVRTGNDVMIGGFVITGSASQTVVIRARGPSLIPFGITNALANPQLQLVRSSDQQTIATNDNWGDAANQADILASGFAPSNSLESAILVTLPPGAYTAIVTGAGGGTGVGIVEVFRN